MDKTQDRNATQDVKTLGKQNKGVQCDLVRDTPVAPAHYCCCPRPKCCCSDLIQEGEAKLVSDHQILHRLSGTITNWDELVALGIELRCDPNDVARLESENKSVKSAAYKILISFYNRTAQPEGVQCDLGRDFPVAHCCCRRPNCCCCSDLIQEGEAKLVRDHQVLHRLAGTITNWDEIVALGNELRCDPDDVARLQNENISIKGAAYKILRSFYNRGTQPEDRTWDTLRKAFRELGKEAVVANLLSGQ